jgi:hypothetical protein
LVPNTTYYVRAYAINSTGIAYGNEQSFTTLPLLSLASLTTNGITNITFNGASVEGNISSDGGTFISERGVCWSTTAGPTTADNKITDGSGIGDFLISITGLLPKTTYYVRAYAINSTGIAYGNEQSFTTLSIMGVNNPSNVNNKISIFPNPSAGVVNLQLNLIPSTFEIRILNVNNEIVYKETSSNFIGSKKMYLDSLGDGVYMVQIIFENEVIIEKLVLSKN